MAPKKPLAKRPCADKQVNTPEKKPRRSSRPPSRTSATANKVVPVDVITIDGEAKRVEPETASRLERAATAMRPCSTIGSYPCREAEQKRIDEHLKTAVKAGGSTQVLYMSGMPGTGKTAVFLDAVERLRKVRGMPNAFVFKHINAMRLGSPNAVFGAIVKQVHEASPNKSVTGASGSLENFFSGRSEKDPVILLLIDEIDQLVTRSQAVLYQIFNWLLAPSSRLVVCAISNTMDLAERLLPRVCSRFTILRVDYKAYSKDQIFQILNDRLRKHDAEGVLTKDALTLCAARVAAAGGDLRKALQLCHRAVELRITQGDAHQAIDLTQDVPPVGTSQVALAFKDLLHSNAATNAVRGLSVKARRLLVALLIEINHSEMPPLRKVLSRYAKCSVGLHGGVDQFGASTWADEGMSLIRRLEAMSLIEVRQLRPGSPVVELLDFKADDLAPVLCELEELPGIRALIGG